MWRRSVVIFGLAVTGAATVWFLLYCEKSPLAFVMAMHHAINQEERFLLYRVDHKVIAQVLRDLAQQHSWTRFDIPALDPQIPNELQVLKPSAIWIYDDRVEIDFGGSFLSFGFRVFKPGVDGYGTKRIADGVWFYSEDNRFPAED